MPRPLCQVARRGAGRLRRKSLRAVPARSAKADEPAAVKGLEQSQAAASKALDNTPPDSGAKAYEDAEKAFVQAAATPARKAHLDAEPTDDEPGVKVQGVKQRLDPMPEAETKMYSNQSVDLEAETNLSIPQNLTYRSPKAHRRRPGNAVSLALRNFGVEFKALLKAAFDRVVQPDKEPSIPSAFKFTLSNEAIAAFDAAHPSPGREPVPPVIQVMYDVLLFFVDRVYEGKAIERFWFLETVARMPYFSYTTCLHLYETLGWWRTGGLRLIHFAEEWNELHHLLIMESLGGDRRWQDRFLGQHCAVFYYWALVLFFIFSPKWSYKFSEMLETHAVSTYRQFIVENEATLRMLPAPRIAQKYYLSDDPYLFNMDSALARGPVNGKPRTPPCETLYDVFVNILEDEWEHVKTMVMCQSYDLMETLKVTQTSFKSESGNRRELWNRWAKDINDMDKMIELRKL